ncbi:putative Ig domain-containing protein [Burkholderia multivorans]|uniref:putative Ig domain-containing protein n=1 Tax=Burkholderia multivorans TaxID=87883 RepID=UPI001C21EA6E|nr:putative Ig domain-containing protein [Burkholderia multivorans]MBU9200070.1 putative Ig domain-containing protein [Burkholderia multivorans]
MKKTILAALIAATALPAMAASYYVVVPVPNHKASADNILVTMSAYALPAGVYGRAYPGFDFNSVLQVLGDPSYSASEVRWSVAGGSLPAGLSLSANGKLSGTPTASGTSSFQVMAAYKTKAGEQAYQVIVADVSVALAAAALPGGVQGTVYSYDLKQNLSVSGDPAYTPSQVTWSLVGGALPAGLQLNADGTVTGTPTVGGTFPFIVKASYLGKAGQQQYQLVSSTVTVTLTGATLPVMTAGTATSYDLTQNLQVTGDPAYSSGSGVNWNLSSGGLPAGMSLSGGTITGTPSAVGSGSAGVTAAYKLGSSSANFGWSVQANVVNNGSYRAWSDGTYAKSCQAYLSPSAPYVYSGATGDGVYRINPAGNPIDVYCNQTTNGGGWTLLMKQAQGDSATLAWGSSYWTGATLNDPSGANMSNGNYVSKAFAVLPVTQLTLQAANESTLKSQSISQGTAMAAMADSAYTVYSGDVAGVPQTYPNWSSYTQNYPKDIGGGTAIKQARFAFNFKENSGSGNGICAGAKWGWAVDETSTATYNGCDDFAIGLGISGGQGFGSWASPTTYYLWGK